MLKKFKRSISENLAKMTSIGSPKGSLRLYNVIFPVWLFYVWPTVIWLWILPANFLVDSLVLVVAMAVYGVSERMQVWKKSILRVWAIGFLSDFIGGLVILGLMQPGDSLGRSGSLWYDFPGEQLMALPGIVIAGVLIYFLNCRVSFRKTSLTADKIHRPAFALAVFTAPYTMLIPTDWIYGW